MTLPPLLALGLLLLLGGAPAVGGQLLDGVNVLSHMRKGSRPAIWQQHEQQAPRKAAAVRLPSSQHVPRAALPGLQQQQQQGQVQHQLGQQLQQQQQQLGQQPSPVPSPAAATSPGPPQHTTTPQPAAEPELAAYAQLEEVLPGAPPSPAPAAAGAAPQADTPHVPAVREQQPAAPPPPAPEAASGSLAAGDAADSSSSSSSSSLAADSLAQADGSTDTAPPADSLVEGSSPAAKGLQQPEAEQDQLAAGDGSSSSPASEQPPAPTTNPVAPDGEWVLLGPGAAAAGSLQVGAASLAKRRRPSSTTTTVYYASSQDDDDADEDGGAGRHKKGHAKHPARQPRHRHAPSGPRRHGGSAKRTHSKQHAKHAGSRQQAAAMSQDSSSSPPAPQKEWLQQQAAHRQQQRQQEWPADAAASAADDQQQDQQQQEITAAACHPVLTQSVCSPTHIVYDSSSEQAEAKYWLRWKELCCSSQPAGDGGGAAGEVPAHATSSSSPPGSSPPAPPRDGPKQSWAPEPDTPLPSPLTGLRSDLLPGAPALAHQPDLQLGTCTQPTKVLVPRFVTMLAAPSSSSGNNMSSSRGGDAVRRRPDGKQQPAPPPRQQTVVTVEEVLLPARLDSSVIRAVKAAALSRLGETTAPAAGTAPAPLSSSPPALLAAIQRLRSVHPESGFAHPSGTAGPTELVLMQARLANGSRLHQEALAVLLSGVGVPLKRYPPSNYAPPNDTPARFAAGDTQYTGPYPIEVLESQWYGLNTERTKCAPNFPAGAPQQLCGHLSLVENDGQMAYRQALAFVATGNLTYAANTFAIITQWAQTNKEMGLLYQNGPLEAGWAVAAMAKALELLRGAPGWQPVYGRFVEWTDAVTMPAMDHYALNITEAVKHAVPHLHGNWHSTVAEAWAAVALLTNNRTRWEQAAKLYTDTVTSYLKWGRGAHADGRLPGECSETLRDIFHSEFGLGGLIQVAEMAWQQDEDLYSASGHALLAAMELHARIINAGRHEELLPPGFRFVESLPPPPSKGGRPTAFWKFNIRTQSWWAHDLERPEIVLSELQDGVKYVVGVTLLPTGWEVGYNHYAGRLGVPMPETARLLASHPIDYFAFHWGLGTLTHADTAMTLWRPGVQQATMCSNQPAPTTTPPPPPAAAGARAAGSPPRRASGPRAAKMMSVTRLPHRG